MRLTAVLALVIAVVACTGDSTVAPSSNGTLNVLLTGTAFADARAVLVTFSEVTAHREGETGSTRVAFDSNASMRTCDLKKLQEAADVLGIGTLTEGRYSHLRLVVMGAALYFDNAAEGPACARTIDAPAGRRVVMEIPSGEVRLNHPFEVVTATNTTIVVDFDGNRSIADVGSGRFRMTPVMTVQSVTILPGG